jgi:hypothetical protein
VIDGIQYIVLQVRDYYNGCYAYDTIVVNIISPDISVNFSGCADSTLTVCIENPELFVGQYFNILGCTLSDTTNNILITDTTHCISVKVDSIFGQFGVAVYNSLTHLPMSQIVQPQNYSWPIVSYFTGNEFTCFGAPVNYISTPTNPIYFGDTTGYHIVTIDWGFLDSLGAPVNWSDTLDGSSTPSTVYPAPGIYNVTITTLFTGCPGEQVTTGQIKVIDGFRLMSTQNNRCSSTVDFYLRDECFKDYFFVNHPDIDFEDIEEVDFSVLWVFGDGDTLNDFVENTSHTYDSAGTYHVYMHLTINDTIVTSDSLVITILDGIDLTVTPDTALIMVGDSIQLNASATGGTAPYAYEWSPVDGLSNPYIYNPYAQPDTVMYYYATAYDSKGCYSQAQLSVIKALQSITPGLSVETSGCPGSMIEICVDNPEGMVGMEIHIDGYILADGCENVIVINGSTKCFECQIISVYGIPSISVIDPATGLIYNNLVIIQANY